MKRATHAADRPNRSATYLPSLGHGCGWRDGGTRVARRSYGIARVTDDGAQVSQVLARLGDQLFESEVAPAVAALVFAVEGDDAVPAELLQASERFPPPDDAFTERDHLVLP